MNQKINEFWQQRSKLDNFLWKDLTELNVAITNQYLQPNWDILDLGCGDGASTQGLKYDANIIMVDYVRPKNLIVPPNAEYIQADIKNFNPGKQFDLITLYGVANSFEEEDIAKIYYRCYSWLKPGGILLIKHQCGKERDIIIDKWSEELGCNYCAYYYSFNKHYHLLRRAGFNPEIFDPYPLDQNKWNDTIFKAFVCKKISFETYPKLISIDDIKKSEVEWEAMHLRRKDSSLSRESKTELLRILKSFLDTYDIVFYLMYGSLLGAIRDNDFIEWDTDVDIAILGRFQNRLAQIINHMNPLKPVRFGDNYSSFMYQNEFVDIYTFTESDDQYVYCGGINSKFDEKKEVFDNPSKICFKGMNLLTVANPIDSLAKWYGPNWQIPFKV